MSPSPTCAAPWRRRTSACSRRAGGRERLAVCRRAIGGVLKAAGVRRTQLLATCVGCTGGMDADTGRVLFSGAFPDLSGVNLRTEFERSVPRPVLVENDCNLAVIAERWRGVAREVDDVICVLATERLGAGIVVAGQLVRGHAGAAGEMPFLGAYEAHHGAEGIAELVRTRAAAVLTNGRAPRGADAREWVPTPQALAAGDPQGVDAEAVFRAAQAGDPLAVEIVEEALQGAGRAIVTMALVLNPELVVIGGGVANAGGVVTEPLRRLLEQMVRLPPRLEASPLAEHGVVYGAIRHALDDVSAGRSTGCTNRHSPRRAERPRDAPRGPRGTTTQRGRARRRRRRVPHALRALLHRAARSARARSTATTRASRRWERLLDAMARTAAARAPELRTLDHEREITPDWLQREQAVGYVTYVDRFAGTLRGRARAAAVPARARRQLPAPDAAAARAARSPTTAATRSPTTARSSRRSGTMDDLRALAADLRADGHGAVHRRRAQPHRARARLGAAARAGDAGSSPTTARSPTARSPTPTSGRCPRSSRTSRPATSPGSGARALGVDDVQRLPVGPRLHEPRRLPGDGRGDARAGGGRRRRAAARRRAVPVEAQGHELPEPARGPRAPAGASARRCGSPRRRSRFKAEAIVSPRELVAYLGTGRHEGKECDLAYHNVLMVLLWSALASGRVALLTQHAARHAAGAAGRRLGDLRALPRRHRLGDHARGRRARWARTRYLHRRFLADFYAGDFPGIVRARRALPARSAHGRGAHERHGGVAGRAGGALESGDGRGATSPCGASCCCTRSRSRTAGCRSIYMGDELGLLQRPRLGGGPAHARRQPLDAPPADGLGGRRAPARPGHRRGPAVERAAAAGRRAPRTRAVHAQGASSRSGRATTTSSALLREHAGERLLLLAQLQRRPAGRPRSRSSTTAASRSTPTPPCRTGAPLRGHGEFLVLEPYQYAWLQGAVGP